MTVFKKIFIFFLLIFSVAAAKAQTFTAIHNAQAIDWIDAVKYFKIPYGPTPTLNGTTRYLPGALFFNTTDSSLYSYTGSQWIKSGGGGSGNTNSNIGSGYRWTVPNTNNVKTFRNGFGLLLDSATTGEIKGTVDTAALSTVYNTQVNSWAVGGNVLGSVTPPPVFYNLGSQDNNGFSLISNNIQRASITNDGTIALGDVSNTTARFFYNGDVFLDRLAAGASTDSALVINTSTKKVSYKAFPSSGGTVTSVSVVSANGLAGTVATSTTTPAITLSTPITGTLKGNGTAISAAALTDLNTTAGSQTQNTFWAAPNGSSGTPSFRAIVAADVPTLNQNTTGSAAFLTTTRTFAISGSTGLTATAQNFNGTANVSLPLAGTLTEGFGGTNQSTYTTGDILYASASNTLSKLPIGTAKQTLHIVGGVPAWRDTSASGGSTPTLQQVITAGNALSKDDTINVGTHFLDFTGSGSGAVNTRIAQKRFFAIGQPGGNSLDVDFDDENNNITVLLNDPSIGLTVNGATKDVTLRGTGITALGDQAGDGNGNVLNIDDPNSIVSIDNNAHDVKVGIGTNAPGYKLDVQNGNGVKFATTSIPDGIFNVSDDGTWYIGQAPTESGGFINYNGTNIFISPTGGGETTVIGQLKNTALAGSGDRIVMADGHGVLSAPVSDRRAKQGIVPLGMGLADLMKLHPVNFEYKDAWKSRGTGTQIGFIAQDVATVLPNSTYTTTKTGMMGYNELDMIPRLVRTVQQQQKIIDALNERICILEKQNK